MARERADRAECGYCGFPRPVKKDGTLFKHGVYVGWTHRDCPGSGKTPTEAAKGWGSGSK